MSQKKYSCRLRREIMEGIITVIDALLSKNHIDDDDKLLMCVLNQVRHKIAMKLLDVQVECRISFTAAEAFSLRLLGTDYVTDKTTMIGNRLHQVANEVHRLYK